MSKNENGFIESEVLTNDTFAETIENGVVFVDFWAPWCGPCRIVAPIVEDLAEEFEGKASICKVNVDDYQDIAVKYGVSSIPTFIIFKDGEVVDTIVGVKSKAEYSEKISTFLNQ